MAHISTKELDPAKGVIAELHLTNPLLTPEGLRGNISDFERFSIYLGGGLWAKRDAVERISANIAQADKVALFLSGISAGGKGAIEDTMLEEAPRLLYKIRTATSRDRRLGESDSSYHFLSKEVFQQKIAANELIEYVEQGEGNDKRWYGLPKDVLRNALDAPQPILIFPTEMSAWDKVESVLAEQTEKIFPLKMFVLPEMTWKDYEAWLRKNRPDNEIQGRIDRAGWELLHAQNADIVVVNTIREDKIPLHGTSRIILGLSDMLLNENAAEKLRQPIIGGQSKALQY